MTKSSELFVLLCDVVTNGFNCRNFKHRQGFVARWEKSLLSSKQPNPSHRTVRIQYDWELEQNTLAAFEPSYSYMYVSCPTSYMPFFHDSPVVENQRGSWSTFITTASRQSRRLASSNQLRHHFFLI